MLWRGAVQSDMEYTSFVWKITIIKTTIDINSESNLDKSDSFLPGVVNFFSCVYLLGAD